MRNFELSGLKEVSMLETEVFGTLNSDLQPSAFSFLDCRLKTA